VLSELSTQTALTFLFYRRDPRVGGSGDIALQILKSVLDGGEWSALLPSCPNPYDQDPQVPRAGLGTVGKR
jgi:hypothetical protein